MAGARAEERRRLVYLAEHGDPAGPVEQDAPPADDTAPAPPKPITFTEAVAVFMAGKAITAIKPSTRKRYQEILGTRLLPRWSSTPCDQITYREVEALDAEMVKEGLAASTRRNVQITLRSVLDNAVHVGVLQCMQRMPALPKVGRTVVQALTEDEVDALLRAATPCQRLAFLLATEAGLRAGEIRGLRWTDVDWKLNQIVVRRTITRGEEATPKSGHERKIPLSTTLRAALEEAKKSVGGPWDPVSLNSDGKPWGEWGLIGTFKRVADRAGLPTHWRFHDLRHHFVTRLLRRGVPSRVVQELAGHEELTTTERYAHVDDSDLHEAMARADRGNHVVTGLPSRGRSTK